MKDFKYWIEDIPNNTVLIFKKRPYYINMFSWVNMRTI